MPDMKKYDLILDALQKLLEERQFRIYPSVKLRRGQESEREAFTITFRQRMPFWTH